jgi:hypothetical protein
MGCFPSRDPGTSAVTNVDKTSCSKQKQSRNLKVGTECADLSSHPNCDFAETVSVTIIGRKAGTAPDTSATRDIFISPCSTVDSLAVERISKTSTEGSTELDSSGYNSADEHASGCDWDPADEVRRSGLQTQMLLLCVLPRSKPHSTRGDSARKSEPLRRKVIRCEGVCYGTRHDAPNVLHAEPSHRRRASRARPLRSAVARMLVAHARVPARAHLPSAYAMRAHAHTHGAQETPRSTFSAGRGPAGSCKDAGGGGGGGGGENGGGDGGGGEDREAAFEAVLLEVPHPLDAVTRVTCHYIRCKPLRSSSR